MATLVQEDLGFVIYVQTQYRTYGDGGSDTVQGHNYGAADTGTVQGHMGLLTQAQYRDIWGC